MGRSPSFCFKACAGEPPDNDDVSPPPRESKASPDKRRWSFRWSFRRRSDRHHVPNNAAIPDPLSNINETFESEIVSSTPEKASTVKQLHQRLLLSSVVSSRSLEKITNTADAVTDCCVPEHIAIVIQTCIRGYMAHRELHKYKKIVKLQAAARGYLVRRQAAGTFRCIQAIVKLQALARAHRSLKSADLMIKKKLDVDVKSALVEKSDLKLQKTPSVTRKLISNAFVRQLMKSTAMSKPIYIRLDPLRPDSAWNWLERWMAATLVDQQKLSFNEDVGNDAKSEFPSHVQEVLAVKKDKFAISTRVCDNSDNLSQIQLTSDSGSHLELDNNSNIANFVEDAFENSSQNQLHGSPEIEGDEVENALIKSRNATFAAVPAKFEELRSTSCSIDPTDAVSESNADHSQVDSTSKETRGEKPVFFMDFTLDEKLDYPNSIQGAPSVSGTEVSLDRSEIGLTECVPDFKMDVEIIVNAAPNFEQMITETNSQSSFINAVEPKSMAESFESLSSLTSSAKTGLMGKQPVEQTSSTLQIQGEYADGSSRSHTTVTESHGEPSSPLDIDLLAICARKKQPQVAANNLLTNSRNNAKARSSGEYLRKDSNSSHWQKSSGKVKTDQVDDKNRNNSDSLPRYMKPTESAKAKLNTDISQKSSPDLPNKDNYLKKRQSLPTEDGKQGSSPRIRRAASQALGRLKENGVPSPSSSERRWQI
ncbi:Protein IQ-domain 32 [Apostasia shenzhenica]|uniref:Protein IQ-domain 32 n=1 Tax=Apostasia shenzhenica TaxID=1088818 RepID=A0A2I0AR08_9ASPA|nr:Protein IQ-domain 32 [Apostasia shenzhenica]